MNLSQIKSIHFTGLKGVGMTSLALCAQDLRISITGSDTDEIFPTTDILNQRGLKASLGFKPTNLPSKLDLLIYTGAHGGATNPEVKAARAKNIPVLNHAQALKLFTQSKQTIAVAGVGGKSTTSAMIATILEKAGRQPSFAVGVGNIPCLNTPGKMNQKSSLFVVESDEYVADPTSDSTPRFHYLKPHIAIITNIEHDHPDVYPGLAEVFKAFVKFVTKIPQDGAIIANFDNPRVRQFIDQLDRPVTTYGFSPRADWQIIDHHLADQKQLFSLKFTKEV